MGCSARLILRELELAGRIRHGEVSVSVVQRLLRGRGLSGPQLELEHAARYRWEASMCGELWQADAMHGPMLMNPATGRTQRAIIFGLIDDRSRLIPYLEAGFGETEQRFLTVLYNAMARRGIVRGLLRDNHAASAALISGFCARGFRSIWCTAVRATPVKGENRALLAHTPSPTGRTVGSGARHQHR